VELAANLLTGSADDRYYFSEDRELGRPPLGTRGCEEALAHIAVADDWQRLRCAWRFETPARVFRFPLDTVSQSEGGQERVHQGCVLVPCWPLVPGADGRFSLEIQMAFYEG
jgi:alpha-amylase